MAYITMIDKDGKRFSAHPSKVEDFKAAGCKTWDVPTADFRGLKPLETEKPVMFEADLPARDVVGKSGLEYSPGRKAEVDEFNRAAAEAAEPKDEGEEEDVE